jgi:hypothetical protein
VAAHAPAVAARGERVCGERGAVAVARHARSAVERSGCECSVGAPRYSIGAGSIELDIDGVRVRLRGTVDAASLRCVLQALRERA